MFSQISHQNHKFLGLVHLDPKHSVNCKPASQSCLLVCSWRGENFVSLSDISWALYAAPLLTECIDGPEAVLFTDNTVTVLHIFSVTNAVK